jgi:hypothetical protein
MVFFANDNLDESKSVYRSFLDGDLDYLIRGRDGSLGLAPSVKALYGDAVERIPAPMGAEPKPYTPAPQTMLAIRQWEAARREQRVGRADVLAWQGRLRLDALNSAVRDLASDWQGNVPWSTSVAVDTLKQYCRPPECKPLVAYIPPSEFWSPDPRAKGYRERIKRYVEHVGVAFVDTSPELESIGPRAYARSGPHLSPDGYTAAAEVISTALSEASRMTDQMHFEDDISRPLGY